MAIQAAQWPRSGGPAGHDPRTELAPPLPRFDPKNPNPNKNERLGPPENSIESPDFPTIPEPQEILPVDPGIPIPPGPESPTENLPMSLEIPTERFQPEIDPSALNPFDSEFPLPSDNRPVNPRLSPNDPRLPTLEPGEKPRPRKTFIGRPAWPVKFDGSTYAGISSAFSGISDSKVGICSFWYKAASDGGVEGVFHHVWASTSANTFVQIVISKSSSNTLGITMENAAGNPVLEITSTNTITVSDGWTHVLLAWDLANTSVELYLNGVDDSPTLNTVTNDNVDWTPPDTTNFEIVVGATLTLQAKSPGPGYDDVFVNTGGEAEIQLAQFYLNTSETIDITSGANRAKFISSGNKPVYLGRTGDRPTGNDPTVFLNLDPNNWWFNHGSGGGFNITGSLTLGDDI